MLNVNEIRVLTDNQLVDTILEKITTTRGKMKWWQKLLFDAVLSEFVLLLLELKTRLDIQKRVRFDADEQFL